MSLEGILPVWKPAGWTSHDVVAKVRRIVGLKRIGHTGTLDPAVTGVLPLCLGRATRFVEYIQELPKQYEAEMRFGLSTDTEDLTGKVLEQVEHVRLTYAQIEQALAAFIGEVEQLPPMYSAVRVQGKRLYELARQGKEAERKPRKVTIYRIRLLEASLDQPHPEIRFQVECSKGTYIRTLCSDIGKALGLPAVMTALVRTSAGNLTKADCMTLEEIEALQQEGRLGERLIPADRVISHIPVFIAPEEAAVPLLNGRSWPIAPNHQLPDKGGLVRVYVPDGRFIGLYSVNRQRTLIRPVKVFH
jgi:tRNA pseudouridine55 synthase